MAYTLSTPRAHFSGAELGPDSSQVYFLPSETKTWLSEFRVDSVTNDVFLIAAGQDTVRGSNATNWARPDSVSVAP